MLAEDWTEGRDRKSDMIQDIYPSKLDNSYNSVSMRENDILIYFDKDGRILVNEDAGERTDIKLFTTCENCPDTEAIYLFKIDNQRYFMARDNAKKPETNQSYRTVRELRDMCTGNDIYAAFTAYHLWKWYDDNIFCGKCSATLTHAESERALRCPECGNMIYPRINPAVIVGVRNGDKLLITRYRRGYANNALVAGFTEIGETLEETVAREVMEETGVKVKNITYYKSQPWGMAQDILVGFFCDVDGSTDIKMDADELKYAEWVQAEEIVLQPNNLSLTNEMMSIFKSGDARSNTDRKKER